jgi:thiamine biosynthesis lipoprotein
LFGYRTKHNSGLGVTLATLLILLAPPVALAEWIADARPMMGTEVSVYLWSDDPEAGRLALDEAFAEADRIDRLMSTYKDRSEISKINREAGSAPVAVGDELFSLVQRAIDISILTRGAFDITFDSVGQHYDFRAQQRPDAATVEAERRFIDYRLVELDKARGTIRFAEEGVRINLGGIAKGYFVERGARILARRGIEHAVVSAGGDSRLLGDRRGRPWLVAIRDPRGEGNAMHLPLSDEAISTSGDYERYFEVQGVRYHHILEPDSGKPAGGVHSATVIGPDAVITDALSTSVFVMGVDAGLRLIGSLPDYESVVIDAAGSIFYSDGLVPPAVEK